MDETIKEILYICFLVSGSHNHGNKGLSLKGTSAKSPNAYAQCQNDECVVGNQETRDYVEEVCEGHPAR
jgi:hypothetical protein